MEKIVQAPKRLQFEVASVTTCNKVLPGMAAKAALERATRTRVLTCANGDRQVLEQGDFHPLIAAAFLAFKQHYPLVLSPDMIWLTILQGVAQHVQNHAGHLRSRLVSHQTKIELVVEAALSSLPENDEQMLRVTREFALRIARHVPQDKQLLFQTEFSTTTDVERIAQFVALMDTFQPYFDYVMYCVCGIPSVILEGTPGDWELLKTKVDGLHASDLELSWWTVHLLPLCDQFVRAARGEVDLDHWKNLCKVIERYGLEDLNGWLLKFIPYLRHDRNEPAIHRNPVLKLNVFPDPTGSRQESRDEITGCTSNMLPSGVSCAPVKCVNPASGQNTDLEFVAGLVGVTQSPQDFSLRAVTGWAICEGLAIDRHMARLRLEHEVQPPPASPDPWDLIRTVFTGGLPGDVWRFYLETNGAIIKQLNLPAGCRILPLEEIKPAWDIYSHRMELQASQKRGELSMQEFKDQQDFNWAYGGLLRIAELGDGNCYVFGRYPEVWKGLVHRTDNLPSKAEQEAQAVFLWTGQPTPESFQFAAPSFSAWLGSLLDGEALAPANPSGE